MTVCLRVSIFKYNVKVAIIEDDEAIASFVAQGLKEHGYQVDVFGSAEEALALPTLNNYDAYIVDLMLPGRDGYQFIEELRRLKSEAPLLILSAKGDLADKLRAFALGSDDYLTKPFSLAELLARLQALLRRASKSKANSTLVVADLHVDLLKREVKRGEKLIELQPREYELLVYFMQNAGNVITKTMIMEQIWNYYFDPQSNVVDVLVHRLRRKIDTGFEKKLIHTVRGVGYVLKIL